MRRGKYLAKNTAIFALGNIGTKAISFFMVPLYTQWLVPSDYGVVDLIATVAFVLMPVFTLNIGESVMRFDLDEGADYDRIMSVGIVFLLLSVALTFLVYPFSLFFSELAAYKSYLYLYCLTYGFSTILICNLRGLERLLSYAIANIILTFGIAVFNMLFLGVFRMGVKGYLLSYIVAQFVVILFAFITGSVKHTVDNFSLNFDLLKEMVKYSFLLITTSLMWWIMNSSDRLMVTAMIGVSANGIYAISYKIPSFLTTLSTVFNQAWSYSAIKENESTDKVCYTNKVYFQLLDNLIIITAVLLFLMKPFMKVYVSKEYYLAWKYTPYLLIGMLFCTLGTFLSTAYTVNKDSKGFLWSGTIGAIVNIVLNLILIPIMQCHGAALATCISYILVFIFRAIHTRKYLKLRLFIKNHYLSIGILIIMAFSMYINNMILSEMVLAIELLLIMILKRDTLMLYFYSLKNLVYKMKRKK